MVRKGYFVTYTSTSWSKAVATTFIGAKDGMILQIDQKWRDEGNWLMDKEVCCCDVSWISKFPDECEVLFARHLKAEEDDEEDEKSFKCEVIDESSGIQTVILKGNEREEAIM